MKSEVSKKIVAAALLLALALVSFFPVAQKMSQPQTFSHAIESLDKKQETVLELTAASTAASAAITLLPGDAATPIAEKLADLSGYFLIVLCAIFLEKYLLTIMAGAAFRVLLPLACVLLAASLFFCRDTLRALSKKLALFALAVVLIIPTSIFLSDSIEATYRASIDATVESAMQTTEAIGKATDENTDSEAKSGLSGLFSKVTEGISSAATDAVDKLKSVLNDFLEALAVMLVTSCLIPVLVLVFFVWLVKLFLGVDLPAPRLPARAKSPAANGSESGEHGAEP